MKRTAKQISESIFKFAKEKGGINSVGDSHPSSPYPEYNSMFVVNFCNGTNMIVHTTSVRKSNKIINLIKN